MPGLDINQFIDLNDSLAVHLKCGICADIFDKPVETQCRHTFCEECIKKWFETNPQKECPFCRKTLNDSNFQINRLISEIISDLKVKCQSKGCNSIISFGSLAKHLNECEFKNCAKCGFLMGNIYQHNCLELTKTELAKSNVMIDKLKNDFKNHKNNVNENKKRNKLEMDKLKSEIETLKFEISNLQVENSNLKAPVNNIIGNKSYYIPSVVNPDISQCFEVIDIREFKLTKISPSFTIIELIKALSTNYDRERSMIYCMKNDSSFILLKNLLMIKFNLKLMPELITELIGEFGHVIQNSETPISLGIKDNHRITLHIPLNVII